MVQACFDISNRSGMDHECDIDERTGRQTDRHYDNNAALNYVARPNSKEGTVFIKRKRGAHLIIIGVELPGEQRL